MGWQARAREQKRIAEGRSLPERKVRKQKPSLIVGDFFALAMVNALNRVRSNSGTGWTRRHV